MTVVRIMRKWNEPEILRQTPGGTGVWNGVQFTLDPVERPDYVIVINQVQAPATVWCRPDRVWATLHEPPNEVFRTWHRGAAMHRRVYTTDPRMRGRRFIHRQTFPPWYIGRSYDELKAAGVPAKDRSLCWITSNLKVFKGHQSRMAFLEKVQAGLTFDLYGRGFTPIATKWDALAPSRYALAIENYQNDYYVSEKIVDCFLAWTMPIYYGCRRITDFFPAEAMVQIDINDPDVVDRIRAAVDSDRWKRNREAIAYARELALDRHQFFAFFAGEIHAHMQHQGSRVPPVQRITISNQPRWEDAARDRALAMLRQYTPSPLRKVVSAAVLQPLRRRGVQV